jgi:hypothetical protein
MTTVSDWLSGKTSAEVTDGEEDGDYVDLFLRRLLVDTLSRVLDQPPTHRDRFHAPYRPEMIHISPWLLDSEFAKQSLPVVSFRKLASAESKQDYSACVVHISQEWDLCTPVDFLWRVSLVCYYSLIETQAALSTLHAVEAFNAVSERKHLVPRPIAFAAAAVSLSAALHLCVSRGLFRAPHGIPWLTQALIQVIALHPGFGLPHSASEDSALLCLYSNFACALAASGRTDLARIVVRATEKRARMQCELRGEMCPGGLLRLRGVLLHNQATLMIRVGDWTSAYSSVAELQVLLGLQSGTGFDARLYEIIEMAIDNLDAEFRDLDEDEDGMLMLTDCCSTDADSA